MNPDILRIEPDDNNPLHTSFFEYLDEVSAYVMGYIYCKGIIQIKKKGKFLVIRNRSDIRSLHRIKEILGCKNPISETGVLTIQSNALCNSLISHGFCPDTFQSKKFGPTRMPVIEEKLVRHFVRGYFDANGYCIAETDGREKDSQRLLTQMTFYNKDFMASFQQHIEGSGGPKGSLHIYTNRLHQIKYYFKQSQSFYWYIYNNAVIYNIEKKAKFEYGFGLVHKAKKAYWEEFNKKKKK